MLGALPPNHEDRQRSVGSLIIKYPTDGSGSSHGTPLPDYPIPPESIPRGKLLGSTLEVGLEDPVPVPTLPPSGDNNFCSSAGRPFTVGISPPFQRAPRSRDPWLPGKCPQLAHTHTHNTRRIPHTQRLDRDLVGHPPKQETKEAEEGGDGIPSPTRSRHLPLCEDVIIRTKQGTFGMRPAVQI